MKTRTLIYTIIPTLAVWTSVTHAHTVYISKSHDALVEEAPKRGGRSVPFEDLRIWVRSWRDVNLTPGKPFAIPLRFTFIPTKWQDPDGGIRPATGTDKDTTAEGYDVNLEVSAGNARRLVISLCGRSVVWDAGDQKLNDTVPFALSDGKLVLRVVADKKAVHVIGRDGRDILTTPAAPEMEHPGLQIGVDGRAVKLINMDVYGLRSPVPTAEEKQLAAKSVSDKRILFNAPSYTVYGSRVEDKVYGPPAAFVPDSDTIVSPTRVIEGFNVGIDIWRARPQARVIDHQTIWHPNPGISRFPVIKTQWPTLDAACRVALDVLHRNSTAEFAHGPDQIGLWQAGFFMGQSLGFGVWMRDSTHVALRGGNLIDSDVSRHTLLYTAKSGIDNGVDGVVMPIIGLWDYYLFTGDEQPIREIWTNLKDRIAKMDAQYDATRGLIKAAHSTSNDAFPEPEAGGFALGTETYFMLGYRAMASMGRFMKEDPLTIKAWESRGNLLRENIRKQYWKDSASFFATGPEGSDGYADDFWESSGEEMAIWPRMNIATSEQRRRVLDRLPEVAMNEFGVNVFPYRKESNHFCNAGWVVWTAGMAAAANKEGRLDILEAFIGQQVRNAVTMKTFYEVIDYKSGRSWRWPGQLWQAAGFLSYFYLGVLGMEYDESGLALHPAVPKSLARMEISNFHYRKATLDFKVKGWGTKTSVLLDGKPVQVIPASLEGSHTVEVRAEPTQADLSRPPLKLTKGVGNHLPGFRQANAIECESMKVVSKSGDIFAGGQDMSPWGAQNWSNGRHLVIKANGVGDFVELEFPTSNIKPRKLILYATLAPDFGKLQFSINGKKVDTTFDAYAPFVEPSNPIPLGTLTPRDGKFTLRVEVIGANPSSKGAKYFFGLDCVVLSTK